MTRQVTLAGQVQIASGHGARFLGLMGRRKLIANAGLFLVGTRGVHTLFMRFTIDVVYARCEQDAWRVVALWPQAHPWRLGPWCAAAEGVLELSAGTIARSGTQVGDCVRVMPQLRTE